MTRAWRDARVASGLVKRPGRVLQGELVPPSSAFNDPSRVGRPSQLL
jgi:hypothetical protein